MDSAETLTMIYSTREHHCLVHPKNTRPPWTGVDTVAGYHMHVIDAHRYVVASGMTRTTELRMSPHLPSLPWQKILSNIR